MTQYWLIIFATLGLAMTLIALAGLCFVAGLRWAMVEGRWSRTRVEALSASARLWLGRGRFLLARIIGRSPWPVTRGYRYRA